MFLPPRRHPSLPPLPEPLSHPPPQAVYQNEGSLEADAEANNQETHSINGNTTPDRFIRTWKEFCPICGERVREQDRFMHATYHGVKEWEEEKGAACVVCKTPMWNWEVCAAHISMEVCGKNPIPPHPATQRMMDGPKTTSKEKGKEKAMLFACDNCTFVNKSEAKMEEHKKSCNKRKPKSVGKNELLKAAMKEGDSKERGASDAKKDHKWDATEAILDELAEARVRTLHSAATDVMVTKMKADARAPTLDREVENRTKALATAANYIGKGFQVDVCYKGGVGELLNPEMAAEWEKAITEMIELDDGTMTGRVVDAAIWAACENPISQYLFPHKRWESYEIHRTRIEFIGLIGDEADERGVCPDDMRPVVEQFDLKLHPAQLCTISRDLTWTTAETLLQRRKVTLNPRKTELVSLALLKDLCMHANMNTGSTPQQLKDAILRVTSRTSHLNINSLDEFWQQVKANTMDIAYLRGLRLLTDKNHKIFHHSPGQDQFRAPERPRLIALMGFATLMLMFLFAFLALGRLMLPPLLRWIGSILTDFAAGLSGWIWALTSVVAQTSSLTWTTLKQQLLECSNAFPVMFHSGVDLAGTLWKSSGILAWIPDPPPISLAILTDQFANLTLPTMDSLHSVIVRKAPAIQDVGMWSYVPIITAAAMMKFQSLLLNRVWNAVMEAFSFLIEKSFCKPLDFLLMKISSRTGPFGRRYRAFRMALVLTYRERLRMRGDRESSLTTQMKAFSTAILRSLPTGSRASISRLGERFSTRRPMMTASGVQH